MSKSCSRVSLDAMLGVIWLQEYNSGPILIDEIRIAPLPWKYIIKRQYTDRADCTQCVPPTDECKMCSSDTKWLHHTEWNLEPKWPQEEHDDSHIHIYIYIYVYMYVCMHTYTYISVWLHIYIHMICIWMYIYIYAYIDIHTYIYVYIHKYTSCT